MVAGRTNERTLERQLAAAEQITHIGSWTWDVTTGSLSWSDELFRIYGLEPRSREITFETFLDLLHPDDRERVAALVAAAREARGRFQWIERVIRADGEVRELETIGEVLEDEGGGVTAMIGTCRDVTEERQREETVRRYGDIFAGIQIGLLVLAVSPDDGGAGVSLVSANPAAVRALGVPASHRGAGLSGLLPSIIGPELRALLVEVARDGKVRDLAEHRPPGTPTTGLVFAVKIFPLPGGCVGVAFDDRSGEIRSREIQNAERRILEALAAGSPLPDVLGLLVREIELLAPPAIASVLLLDEAGERLRHGAAPGLPRSYVRAIDGSRIGPVAGSCGTAAYRRQRVFVNDIATDPLWADWRDLALDSGLRACWSSPIFASDGAVLGTFALYYREPRGPGAADLELIERAGHIAAIAIQRRRLDDQLRALSTHIEAAREHERTGIAREIHDVLGGTMTALKLDLSWIARRVVSDPPIEPGTLVGKLRELTRATDQVISEVRRISAELRPVELDDLGLTAALEWQAVEFEKRTSIACSVTSNLGGDALDHEVSTAIFRIFQEGLTNVARHAQASHVDVRLVRDDDRLLFEMSDDGRGITARESASPRAFGLLGIRERANALGGRATIEAAAPTGTRVTVELPAGRDPPP